MVVREPRYHAIVEDGAEFVQHQVIADAPHRQPAEPEGRDAVEEAGGVRPLEFEFSERGGFDQPHTPAHGLRLALRRLVHRPRSRVGNARA